MRLTLTSRRRRPIDRSIPHLRDTKLVVIATEGDTEAQYFEMFSRLSSRVQVIPLPSKDGLSAPRHVLARMRDFRRANDLRGEDSLCLVIDRDRWPEEQLAEVATHCCQLSILLAVSCPCFEVWLYLHHADPPQDMADMTGQEVKQALRQLLGQYNETNLRWDDFEPHVAQAVGRAKALDVDKEARWPCGLGTRAYRVVELIVELA